MSVRQRVYDISWGVASTVAQTVAEVRIMQIAASLNTMCTVAKVVGNQVTINLPDGSQKIITNVGGRVLGKGDAVVTDGNAIGF